MSISKSGKSAQFRHIVSNNLFYITFLNKFFNAFWYLFGFCHKHFFKVILVLFPNFEAKCAKTAQKNGNPFFTNMPQNLVMQPSTGYCNQVVKIVVPYCSVQYTVGQSYCGELPQACQHIRICTDLQKKPAEIQTIFTGQQVLWQRALYVLLIRGT